MTVYAETSAVLRWLFAEEKGEAPRVTLAAAEKVTSSRLTLIETRRVVRRAERDGRGLGKFILGARHLARGRSAVCVQPESLLERA